MTKPAAAEQKTHHALVRKLRRSAPYWIALILFLIGINYAVGSLLTLFPDPLNNSDIMMSRLMILSLLLLYAILLAIPFMPGMEVGVSLLVAHGAMAAPLVYGATFLGLGMSYFLGALFAERLPCGFLEKLGLNRTCAFIDEMKVLNREQRLQRMQQSLPRWAGKWLLGHRYILLALVLNLPGNGIIGGGGGIMMMAGMSRLFSFPAVAATVALATAPVPIAVWFLGPGILHR